MLNEAKEHYETLISLIDEEEDDDLSRLLTPIADFLKHISESTRTGEKMDSKPEHKPNTLKAFCERTDIKPTHPTTETGAVSLIVPHDTPHLTDLWNLEDYAVSSRSGIVVWLTPRKNTKS